MSAQQPPSQSSRRSVVIDGEPYIKLRDVVALLSQESGANPKDFRRKRRVWQGWRCKPLFEIRIEWAHQVVEREFGGLRP